MNTFIQQGQIQLIKSVSTKDCCYNISISNKLCSFELSIHQRILKNVSWFPQKCLAEKLFSEQNKCFLSTLQHITMISERSCDTKAWILVVVLVDN